MTTYPDSKLMTEEENRLYDLTTELYSRFVNLDCVLGVDAQEMAQLTNRVKSLIMSRPFMRELAENGLYDGLTVITSVNNE